MHVTYLEGSVHVTLLSCMLLFRWIHACDIVKLHVTFLEGSAHVTLLSHDYFRWIVTCNIAKPCTWNFQIKTC